MSFRVWSVRTRCLYFVWPKVPWARTHQTHCLSYLTLTGLHPDALSRMHRPCPPPSVISVQRPPQVLLLRGQLPSVMPNPLVLLPSCPRPYGHAGRTSRVSGWRPVCPCGWRGPEGVKGSRFRALALLHWRKCQRQNPPSAAAFSVRQRIARAGVNRPGFKSGLALAAHAKFLATLKAKKWRDAACEPGPNPSGKFSLAVLSVKPPTLAPSAARKPPFGPK